MKKILIASHGRLAAGVMSSVELLAGTTEGITTINAYVEDSDLELELEKFIEGVKEEDQVFAFTDLFGGSVNQKVTQSFLENQLNATVISGFNFPILLEILLAPEDLSEAQVNELLEKCRQELQAQVLKGTVTINDEEDFF